MVQNFVCDYAFILKVFVKGISVILILRIPIYYYSVPMILVGTKHDLREDSDFLAELSNKGQKPITPQQGEALAKELGMKKYVECSACTQHNVKEVFDDAVRVQLNKEAPPKRSRCTLI
mmetsp:Transcript_19689/g.32501  ORF Transcript_19689/g.32501 Transcript_19689/m.32501 type:complete len:119 (+) Transcript_19689:634-990(+)